MKNLFILLVIIGFGTLAGCKKLDKVNAVTVSFTIDQPTENANVVFGESLHMEGTIAGTGQMHGYTIELINKANGSIDYSFASSTHSTEYYFHEHFENTVLQTTNYTLRIEVSLDHNSGETETKEMNVTFVEE